MSNILNCIMCFANSPLNKNPMRLIYYELKFKKIERYYLIWIFHTNYECFTRLSRKISRNIFQKTIFVKFYIHDHTSARVAIFRYDNESHFVRYIFVERKKISSTRARSFRNRSVHVTCGVVVVGRNSNLPSCCRQLSCCAPRKCADGIFGDSVKISWQPGLSSVPLTYELRRRIFTRREHAILQTPFEGRRN